MTEKSIVTFAAENLMNAGHVAGAIVQLREYYAGDGLPPAPLPDNVVALAPCNIKVTESEDLSTGQRIGTIRITDHAGQSLFARQWTVSAGR
jgi:hypothetical protein